MENRWLHHEGMRFALWSSCKTFISKTNVHKLCDLNQSLWLLKQQALMLWPPGSKWSLSSDWFVWLMYLCHSLYKERALLFKPGSDFKVFALHPASPPPSPVLLSVSWSISVATPPLWPYLVLKHHKVYRKSCTTGDISINLHICQMCSVCWALWWNVSM